MIIKRKIVKMISGYLFVASLINSVIPTNIFNKIPASAIITSEDICETTNDVRAIIDKLGVDKEYITCALNLQDPFAYLDSDIAQNFRFLNASGEKITFKHGSNDIFEREFNKDSGKGSANVMRILFPSSEGLLNSNGGFEYCFSKDLKNKISPNFIAKLVSICHKYRNDRSFTDQTMQAIHEMERIKNIEPIGLIKKNEFKLIDNIMKLDINKSTFEIITSKLKEIVKHYDKEKTKSKGETEIFLSLLKLEIHGKNKLDENEVEELKKIISFSELRSYIVKNTTNVDRIQNLIVFLDKIYSYASISKFSKFLDEVFEEKFDEVEKNTLLNLSLNMLYTIQKQETDESSSDDKFLPKYTTEKMLMMHFINRFNKKEEILEFYEKARDLIQIGNQATIPNNNTEKTIERIDIINRLITDLNDKNCTNPYKAKLVSNGLTNSLHTDLKSCNFGTQNFQFQDCVETSMRHILNLLICSDKRKWETVKNCDNHELLNLIKEQAQNPTDKQFLHLPLGERIQLFYKYQDNMLDRSDIEYRSFWNYVVSNIARRKCDGPYSLSYVGNKKEGKNELNSGLLNTLKFVYNVAYSLKEKLNISEENLKAAEKKLNNQITVMNNSPKNIRREMNNENYIETLKECIESVYALINPSIKVNDIEYIELSRDKKDILGIFSLSVYPVDFGLPLNFKACFYPCHAKVDYIRNPLKKDEHYSEMVKCDETNISFILLENMSNERKYLKMVTFSTLYSGQLSNDVTQSPTAHRSAKYLRQYNYVKDIINYFEIINDQGILSLEFLFPLINYSFEHNRECEIFNIFEKDKKTPTSLKELLKQDIKKIAEEDLEYFQCAIPDYIYENEELFYSLRDLIGGKPVYNFNVRSFENNKKLKTYNFFDSPSRVTFDYCAFKDSSLETINIPHGVEDLDIQPYVFHNCKKLKNIKFPNTIKKLTIGKGAFCSSGIETIEFPSNLEELNIESSGFQNCKELKNIVFLGNINFLTIQPDSFFGCGVEKIEFLCDIESLEIEKKGFKGCKNLKEILWPSCEVMLYHDTFDECDNFNKSDLPHNVHIYGLGSEHDYEFGLSSSDVE